MSVLPSCSGFFVSLSLVFGAVLALFLEPSVFWLPLSFLSDSVLSVPSWDWTLGFSVVGGVIFSLSTDPLLLSISSFCSGFFVSLSSVFGAVLALFLEPSVFWLPLSFLSDSVLSVPSLEIEY
ncbi:hypothetical protein [Mycoplasmopsis cynos]|uniref:hypothetical protein n=1 Tax=Mycoplasmopsis cynos TaxID=171284 RepID=UPI00254085E9|nr:hypothetical protein [Mycoplasmopsis cynos]MCU9935407.1 hypothetical protein [Mycoplasmopsis cynos]